MPYSLFNDAFDNNAFHGSLFAFLHEKCNLKIVCADTEFLIPEKNDIFKFKIRRVIK